MASWKQARTRLSAPPSFDLRRPALVARLGPPAGPEQTEEDRQAARVRARSSTGAGRPKTQDLIGEGRLADLDGFSRRDNRVVVRLRPNGVQTAAPQEVRQSADRAKGLRQLGGSGLIRRDPDRVLTVPKRGRIKADRRPRGIAWSRGHCLGEMRCHPGQAAMTFARKLGLRSPPCRNPLDTPCQNCECRSTFNRFCGATLR
jgi:hypothetical protein